MKFNQVPSTYICQLNKTQNRAMLEGYSKRRDKSGAELARFYSDVTNALIDTPAWGVSGVNKMINALTLSVRATKNREKRGKTTAYAQANKLLSTIDHFGNKEANARYCGSYRLNPLLTADELLELAQIETIE